MTDSSENTVAVLFSRFLFSFYFKEWYAEQEKKEIASVLSDSPSGIEYATAMVYSVTSCKRISLFYNPIMLWIKEHDLSQDIIDKIIQFTEDYLRLHPQDAPIVHAIYSGSVIHKISAYRYQQKLNVDRDPTEM